MHEDSNNYFNIKVQKVLLTFVVKVMMVHFGLHSSVFSHFKLQ